MRKPDRFNDELQRYEWVEIHRPSGEELVVGHVDQWVYEWAVEQDLWDDSLDAD